MTTSGPGAPEAPPSREAHFRAVYRATYDDLLRFAQRRVHPSHAEDVAADVFLVAWRRLDEMPEAVEDARPWLFGVARGTMLNHRRGDRRRDALAVRLADATLAGGADAADDLAASRLDLAAGWARLTEAEQEAISLSVWEGLTSAQAGVVLGCSRDGVPDPALPGPPLPEASPRRGALLRLLRAHERDDLRGTPAMTTYDDSPTTRLLRDLDAADRELSPAQRGRADATLERVLATDPGAPAPTATPARRPRRRRLLLAAGGVVAAVTAAIVVVPTFTGGPAAFASWSPVPVPLVGAERAAALEACVVLQSGEGGELALEPDADASALVAEARGGWSYVLFTATGPSGRLLEGSCLVPDDLVADPRPDVGGFFGEPLGSRGRRGPGACARRGARGHLRRGVGRRRCLRLRRGPGRRRRRRHRAHHPRGPGGRGLARQRSLGRVVARR